TAARLGIHHNTVRYRLQQIERLFDRPIGHQRGKLELALPPGGPARAVWGGPRDRRRAGPRRGLFGQQVPAQESRLVTDRLLERRADIDVEVTERVALDLGARSLRDELSRPTRGREGIAITSADQHGTSDARRLPTRPLEA